MTFPDRPDPGLRFAALEIDRDGLVIGWSVAAELLFGHTAAEMTERRLASLLDDADPARLLQALPDPTTRATFTQAAVCRRKDGETFHATLLVTPLDAADGTPRLVVLVVNDERERNRDRFIATVAHD